MLVGLGLLRVVARHPSRLLAALVLGSALVWSGVQANLNVVAVRAEVQSPTPFGFDLARILDAGTPLDETGRCQLLLMIPQMLGNQPWRDTLNELYLDRHGQVFCAV